MYTNVGCGWTKVVYNFQISPPPLANFVFLPFWGPRGDVYKFWLSLDHQITIIKLESLFVCLNV